MEVTKHLPTGMILQVWGGYFLKLGGGGSLQKMGEMIKFYFMNMILLQLELSEEYQEIIPVNKGGYFLLTFSERLLSKSPVRKQELRE